MNYLNLPPGLNRRNAYSNFIDTIRRRRNNILTVYNRHVLSITPIRRNYNRDNYINNYDFFSSLEDVKIGLISKNLLSKSIVKNCEIDNFCVICQDDIEIDSIVRELDCSHEFHINCIDNWFTENKKCPICKYEL